MNFREREQLTLHWKLVFLNAFVLKKKTTGKKRAFLGKQVFYLGHNVGYTCWHKKAREFLLLFLSVLQ